MDEMEQRARETVDAARNGDQNAIAILAGVRRAAKAGGDKAKQAYNVMMKYAKSTTDVPAAALHGDTSTAIVPVSSSSKMVLNKKAIATTGIGALIGGLLAGPIGLIVGSGIGYFYNKLLS